MADLIAIGYPDETTALSAMDEAERLQKELIIQADAVAAIIRNKEGKIRVVTNHHAVGAGATWGMFWGMLFGMLFFVPFLGMAVGAGMGALMGKVTKNAVDKQFQDQVRDMLQPGTSALFMVVEKVTPDKAVEAMSKYGGTVLRARCPTRPSSSSKRNCTARAPASSCPSPLGSSGSCQLGQGVGWLPCSPARRGPGMDQWRLLRAFALGRFRAAASSPRPTPVDLAPRDGEALGSHATEPTPGPPFTPEWPATPGCIWAFSSAWPGARRCAL